MDYNATGWLDRVCGHVKFAPDRRAIRDELSGHIEDKIEDLTAAGMDISEAKRVAVAAMGDPDEVGVAMNRAHKPWLGRLWLFSKAMVIICCALLVLSALAGEFRTVAAEFLPPPGTWEESIYDVYRESGEIELAATGQTEGAFSSGGYTVSVAGAWIWEDEREPGAPVKIVELAVEIHNLAPWVSAPSAEALMMRDSEGRLYGSDGLDWAQFDGKGNCCYGGPLVRHWGKWRFSLIFTELAETAHMPEWVELYPVYNDDLCVRVCFTEAGQ